MCWLFFVREAGSRVGALDICALQKKVHTDRIKICNVAENFQGNASFSCFIPGIGTLVHIQVMGHIILSQIMVFPQFSYSFVGHIWCKYSCYCFPTYIGICNSSYYRVLFWKTSQKDQNGLTIEKPQFSNFYGKVRKTAIKSPKKEEENTFDKFLKFF